MSSFPMTIPESIIRFCYSEGKLNALCVLSHCKAVYGGYTKSLNLGQISQSTGLSSSTVKRCLVWLRRMKWIGKTGHRYYFRSWAFLRKLERMSFRRGWKIVLSTSKEMISQFLSSIVGSVLNSCKRKNRHSPEPAPPGRAAIKPGSCSVRFLAKTLSISNTSAWRMKRLGTIWGYLSVTSQKPEQRLYRLLWAIIRSEERQIDGNPEWYIRQVNPVHVIECNVKSGKVSKLER